MTQFMSTYAIITSAGFGKRMGTAQPKQYLELCGRPILCHTLEKFSASPLIKGIVLVTDRPSLSLVKDTILKQFSFPKIIAVVEGGEKRQDSVWAGLQALPKDCDIVAVHDGVRPFIHTETINKSIGCAKKTGACIVAIPVKDTIKRVDAEGRITETVERAGLWRAQTPQTFKYELLKKAFDSAYASGFYGTDEAMLLEKIGVDVNIVSGDERNIKITTPEDLKIAETLVR